MAALNLQSCRYQTLSKQSSLQPEPLPPQPPTTNLTFPRITFYLHPIFTCHLLTYQELSVLFSYSLSLACWVCMYVFLYLLLPLCYEASCTKGSLETACVSQPVSSCDVLSQLKAFSTSSIVRLHLFGDPILSTAF